MLTLLRLIFVPFVVVAIQQQKYAWALGIFVVAGITDLLDGLLARVLKQKTTLGQYLDPIADKLLAEHDVSDALNRAYYSLAGHDPGVQP